MRLMRSIIILTLILSIPTIDGCNKPPPQYGVEQPMFLPGSKRRVWAIAPVLNLSGEKVDPLLQADLVYEQLQQVQGLTVIPVNRVVEVYAALQIQRVQSPEQAAIVCDALGCDGLIVPTVTAFDPWNPPKLGASLQLFLASGAAPRPINVDPRQLTRMAAPAQGDAMPQSVPGAFVQAVGMYDAANGSVRSACLRYAEGRQDPTGPFGKEEYFVNMDRYCGFVYHALLADLLASPKLQPAARS